MILGVAKETFPGERRVALVPGIIQSLAKAGIEVLIQSTAGQEAGYLDQQHLDKGAKAVATRQEVFQADVLLAVRAAGLNPAAGQADLPLVRPDQVLIGMYDPLGAPQAAAELIGSPARSSWALWSACRCRGCR
jgi:NAD(P) transhydrogenase subunit alpha